MKRKWTALALAAVLLMTMVPVFKGLAFAGAGPAANKMVIEVEKKWEDDADDNRPEELKVELFKNAAHIHEMVLSLSNEWSGQFIVINPDSLDDFSVEEEDLTSEYYALKSIEYGEIVTHNAQLTGLTKVSRGNELTIAYSSSENGITVVVVNKGSDFCVWTASALDDTQTKELDQLLRGCDEIAGINKHTEFQHISGIGATENGATFYSNRVEFTQQSEWSLVYINGKYTPSYASQKFTITNTYSPTTTTTTTTTEETITTTTIEEPTTSTTTSSTTAITTTTEAPTTQEETPTTDELVAGDEDTKETTTTTSPTEVVKGDEDEKDVDVVPTGEGYLFSAVAILFVLAGTVVLVPVLKKRIVKK